MTLKYNDSQGVRVFNYLLGISCFFGHLVFGIIMLTNANSHVSGLLNEWDMQAQGDYNSQAGVFHLMYFYTRNGIAPFLVLNLVILYANIVIKHDVNAHPVPN
jgi:hypothetical protein